MNISEQQLNNMMAAVSVALQPLVRVVPMTPVEWADQNYYLPKESSYGEGEWKTLPFQIAIMNCMGNDQVRTVNGPAVADEFDKPTTDIRKDRCSKCMRGCEMRGMVANFGGFLSINKLSQ
ncbi:terminase large subunit of prophage CP-933O [Escherichia coli]|nr:terminase large subunit of prophage CP-933O [Escherichia coli]